MATATAIDQALATVDEVAAEGDLTAEARALLTLDATTHEAILLPDGRTIYPPSLFGEPLQEVACRLLDAQDPTRSRYLKLIGPPGTGKSQIARAIAYTSWRQQKKKVIKRHGSPFYGLIELQPGPSADEYFFRYDFIPDPEDATRVKLVEAAFVEAMRNGWLVVIDEVSIARDVALLSLNGTLDGRLILYLAATGETVTAQPGFGVILTYNPGLVGATDIPDAWHSRFPATVEVSSNWGALRELGVNGTLVDAAEKYDSKRKSGELAWTPQFREIESLHVMSDRVGERVALSMFISGLHEQLETGKLLAADAAAACRMLDEGGFQRFKVSAGKRKAGASNAIPNLEGYPRAVTR
jgi:hypothetical protein